MAKLYKQLLLKLLLHRMKMLPKCQLLLLARMNLGMTNMNLLMLDLKVSKLLMCKILKQLLQFLLLLMDLLVLVDLVMDAGEEGEGEGEEEKEGKLLGEGKLDG